MANIELNQLTADELEKVLRENGISAYDPNGICNALIMLARINKQLEERINNIETIVNALDLTELGENDQ